MKIGYNGSVADSEDVRISVFDHGFLYGMGLFETFRTYGGEPYLLERHLRRLEEGCMRLQISYRAEPAAIRRLIRDVTAAAAINGDAYVRMTVSAGDEGLGLPAGPYTSPSEIVMVKNLPPAAPELHVRGRELRLLGTPRNTPELGIRMKSLHYMNSIAAKQELMASGASPGSEGLMLTADGWLAEGIVSNLFFVSGGIVRTPSLETGILPGITRGRVMELAREAGMPVEEGLYRWEDLLEADEVWTTGSVQELVPVATLADGSGKNAHPRAGAAAGPICGKLLSLYRADARSSSPGYWLRPDRRF
ncbi:MULTISPECIES: aminotransferase class IV [unclassified Paenibacillus]|uniref:aminotransferase class IV n=1 Tax=unclassified Paenibacillus TaxID=185978 RepID=UPI0009549D46|nr:MULTISPECIES: aminotransferase class IV [unclassified Paenibacillus]ASS67727.1 4-amino-4-deoxychorismate lyase [Paenibacillus sp. RUD330]SIR67531.1 4-amino-4-deoxychorismate lyase [Paenibacillus sp. RU4X]SIR75314.1 4-amino-4-deoxychorismate lyase [Paenibacillus sp. RU4T]